MDLDVFTPVLATMPASLPPNTSLENISQASPSSSRSPPLPPHSQVASVFIVLVVTVIILGTLVGNVLVVVAVFTSRALKAPQNLFLVSLASADILVATLVIPFSLANEVRKLFCLFVCFLFQYTPSTADIYVIWMTHLANLNLILKHFQKCTRPHHINSLSKFTNLNSHTL